MMMIMMGRWIDKSKIIGKDQHLQELLSLGSCFFMESRETLFDDCRLLLAAVLDYYTSVFVDLVAANLVEALVLAGSAPP
jgi:hypothetical protein